MSLTTLTPASPILECSGVVHDLTEDCIMELLLD